MKRSRILALTLALAVLGAGASRAQTSPTPSASSKAVKTASSPRGASAVYRTSGIKEPAFRRAADSITAGQLKDYLTFIASDEMEGRVTPSRGLDATAKFLATQLSRWGVKPAGDAGRYFQNIALKRDKLVPAATEVELAGRKFVYGKDYLATGPSGSVSGPMVFAGDGWYVKEKGIDAYQGIDPKGKVVVIVQAGMPSGMSQQEAMKLLMGAKRGEDWMDPAAYAEKRGAVGLVVLQSLLAQASPETMEQARRTVEEGSYSVEKLPAPFGQPHLPTVVAHLNLVQAIFAREKTDARKILMSFPGGTPVKPFALAAEKKIAFTVKTTTETVMSQNVVAVVEGSDPVLRHEYVALGAHYDHSGTVPPVNSDGILNGADDDGSGTVALLAMAEALAKAPRRPKRSVLFVWHMGEEKGLWGSRYFTSFPTVPLDKVVAQLNIDMIGRSRLAGDTDPRNKDLSGPNELYVIGSKMLSTELGALSEAVNTDYLKLSFNYKYDDPQDPERFFYRSDHIHYATKDVPIIFYFTGVHADYHQVDDEVEKIDFPKFEKIARTIFATAWELGEMKARPKVDKPLPPETKNSIF